MQQVRAAPGSRWYLGGGAAYTQPYFFGLINDIYATAPASLSLVALAGRDTTLVGDHSYGFELLAARSLPVSAQQPGFAPTFSAQYPAGATIHYSHIAQTLGIASLTYQYTIAQWLTLAARLGVGVRHLEATIILEKDGNVYRAASPGGAMAILSVALGALFNLGDYGRIGIFYRTVPPVVYPVAVGTATVRSADMLSLEYTFFLPQ
ncbi:MAG: hypothetical protein ACOY5B_04460 [Spirochaetota bacterium]